MERHANDSDHFPQARTDLSLINPAISLTERLDRAARTAEPMLAMAAR
jgi:hypothetical protein